MDAELYHNEYERLAQTMDEQAMYFDKLLKYVEKHGLKGLSEERRADVPRALRYTYWKNDPVALQLVDMAARKAANMTDTERQELRSNMKLTKKAVRKASKKIRRLVG